MKILFFSTKKYEESYLEKANINRYEIKFIKEPLNKETVTLSKGYNIVSVFTQDEVSADVLKMLKQFNVTKVATRAAGFDNIDVTEANKLNIIVANVPEYSPEAVAEHTVAMMLVLSRNIIRAEKQVKEHDYSIERLIGFNLKGKTIGIIGVGKIGRSVAKILNGFECKLLGYDIAPDKKLLRNIPLEFTNLEKLCRNADIITLHTPLNEETKYLIDDALLGIMKYNVTIINTARGAIINTKDIIKHLKSRHIGAFGMDVYEKEKGIFFINHFGKKMEDDELQILMEMPNVLITPHIAFATVEAIEKIADVTFHNINCWAKNISSENEITIQQKSETVSII